MQKAILLLVSIMLVFSFASCGKKDMENETNVSSTDSYVQNNTTSPETTTKKSLVGEVTSIAEDIKDDIVGDASTKKAQ